MPIPVTKKLQKAKIDSPWNVIVFDDSVNLMAYVAMVFKRVFGYSDERSEQLMMEVHHDGRSLVWSGNREKAEFFIQQLHGYQLRACIEKSS